MGQLSEIQKRESMNENIPFRWISCSLPGCLTTTKQFGPISKHCHCPNVSHVYRRNNLHTQKPERGRERECMYLNLYN